MKHDHHIGGTEHGHLKDAMTHLKHEHKDHRGESHKEHEKAGHAEGRMEHLHAHHHVHEHKMKGE